MLILVGRSELTDAAGIAVPSGLTPDRRNEGFVIVCKGSQLILAGNDEGPYHGTEYAVYDFLRSLGVRGSCRANSARSCHSSGQSPCPNGRSAEKPDFLMRDWWHARAGPELSQTGNQVETSQ